MATTVRSIANVTARVQELVAIGEVPIVCVSGRLERMARKEGSQSLCHAARVLDVEQMICAGKHERLCIRQPIQEQVLPSGKDRGNLRALLSQKGHEVERGIADIQQGVDARQWRDHFHFAALFAEACGNAGHVERGLAVLKEKLARAHQTGTRYYEAELHRLAGELRLKSGIAAEEDDAERDFHMAIEVARQQMAKSLELRAVMSLTRLWQRQGKRSGAPLLAEAYGQFTEGFTTTDLQKAKLLLQHC